MQALDRVEIGEAPSRTTTPPPSEALASGTILGKRSPTSVMNDSESDPLTRGELSSCKQARLRTDTAQHELQLKGCEPLQSSQQQQQQAAEVWEELVLNHLLELAQILESEGSREQLERAARIEDLCMLAV